MAAKDIDPPLIVIVGPTASGKTSLAVELAKKYNGEIISADSRAVYRGMDIGTAKPTVDERQGIPHWGIDIVDPDESFTAADFKNYALERISDIRRRGRTPFLVGGTGLYVDSVIFDYQFGQQPEPQLRAALEKMTISELQNYCVKNNIKLPQNRKNKRYLVRAIEQKGINQRSSKDLIGNTYVAGIATDKDVLRQRISLRSEQIFSNNVVNEASSLGAKYGWGCESMTGNVYPLVHAYLQGDLLYQEMVNKNVTLDWRLAKRQMTWLKRNPYIWWGSIAQVRDYLDALLANR